MKYFNFQWFQIFFLFFLFYNSNALSDKINLILSEKNVSNYFSGIVSINQNNTSKALDFFNKIQPLKYKNANYNIHYLKVLISLNKFNDAISYANKIEPSQNNFIESNLLLGLDAFKNKNYKSAQKYFSRLDGNLGESFAFKGFFDNFLISWIHAVQNDKEESVKFINRIPNHFNSLKKIQLTFLNCYFDSPRTLENFYDLTSDLDVNFSRYNFFLANYLLHNNNFQDAGKIITEANRNFSSNILLKQSKDFISEKKYKNIKKFYNCKKPTHTFAEFFYIIANIYATDENYNLSNFYLKIALFLNSNFLANKNLLAENYYFQKRYEDSKAVYNSIKKIGEVYKWHSIKSIAHILMIENNQNDAVNYFEKEFRTLKQPNFQNYYDIANLYRQNGNYGKAVEYYTLSLNGINSDHYLVPKILDGRGITYDLLKEWKKSENDLRESLKKSPNQPYVLNYLGYSFVDREINIKEALQMLKKANSLKENDGYILDSVGWALYLNKKYIEAEKFLRRAIEIMPFDPIINDHYGDVLWALNKEIQARYFWGHVSNLDEAGDKLKELKESVNKKIIIGKNKKL